MIGARIARTSAMTMKIAWAPPPELLEPLSRRRPVTPPQNVKRRKKSARSAIAPTSTPTSSEKRMS